MTLIDPNVDIAFLVLRLALGVVFLAHGPAKLQKSQQMSQMLGMKAGMIMMVGLVETVGAALVILGVWTQIGALLLALVMIGAIYFKTQKWNKNFTGEMGYELDFMVLAGALAVLLGAPSTYSLF